MSGGPPRRALARVLVGTPSTLFFAMSKASRLSRGPSAAPVSVVKKGLPVPEAKMTTRGAVWRAAGCRARDLLDLDGRLHAGGDSAPSSAACKARAFMTVPSIAM